MEKWKAIVCVIAYSIILLFILRAFQDTPFDKYGDASLQLRKNNSQGEQGALQDKLFDEYGYSISQLHKENLQAAPTETSPQICSQDERTRRMKRWCEIQRNINKKPFPRLHLLDTSALKSAVRMLLVDDKHKVLYCDIAKAGSTTWKHILANNTGHYNESQPQIIHGMDYIRRKYNISQLMLMSREQILVRLDTYFTFIVVRHPLDRLVSGYKDKMAGNNTAYERGYGKYIIKLFRQNPSREALETGRGVTFEEYLSFLSGRMHVDDQHFENYQDHCQPCIINYDYIVKLETQDVDGKYVIEEHLSGFGADNLVNAHSNRGGATLSKHLHEFDEISRERLHEVREVYERDMDMFGYSVEERDGKILAACGDSSVAGCC